MSTTTKKGLFKRLFGFVKEMANEFTKDNVFTLAAALSYYTVFSIAPLLVIVIAVTSFFLGPEAVQGELYEQLGGLLGAETAKSLEGIVQNAYSSGDNVVATIISVGVLLFTATAVVNQLKMALNAAWNIKEDPDAGIMQVVKDRLLSLTFILGLGFIFLVSLGLNSVAAFFSDYIVNAFGFLDKTVTLVVPQVVAGIITLIAFMLLFKYLPDARIKWKHVFVGALFTTILFSIGKYAIGFYIGNSDIASTFGSAGALASLMLWVFYSSTILILGAEFTQVWIRHSNARILPNENAIRVKRKEIYIREA
ncbi:MAG: YihY/virulence factor BrkB family protein [Bacteroidota bacterium]